MIFHEYKVHDKYGCREKRTGVDLIPALMTLCALVCVIIFACASRSEIATKQTEIASWEGAYTTIEAEKAVVTDKAARLLMLYENLSCKTRGLTVTTVKGITLCMNPETKALHKIDENAD